MNLDHTLEKRIMRKRSARPVLCSPLLALVGKRTPKNLEILMLVFLSWSGDRSKAVADAVSSWLSQVVQAVEPWLSRDIAKGTRWGPEVADKLEKSRVGIVCLTPENLDERWILFEAGALSKTKDAYVCTLLLDVKPIDVKDPLSQFQHTQAEKDDVKRLIGTINRAVGASDEKALADALLDEVFETNWPRLADRLDKIRSSNPLPDKVRSERELLEEMLEILRRQEYRLGQTPSSEIFSDLREEAKRILRRTRAKQRAEALGLSLDEELKPSDSSNGEA